MPIARIKLKKYQMIKWQSVSSMDSPEINVYNTEATAIVTQKKLKIKTTPGFRVILFW